jgi:hypothetical protein
MSTDDPMVPVPLSVLRRLDGYVASIELARDGNEGHEIDMYSRADRAGIIDANAWSARSLLNEIMASAGP